MNAPELREAGKSSRRETKVLPDYQGHPGACSQTIPSGVGETKVPHRFLIKRQEKVLPAIRRRT